MNKYTLNQIHSPNIGIGLKKKINKRKVSKNTLLYVPRKKIGYDTIFFLGMIKFSKSQIKKQSLVPACEQKMTVPTLL